MKKNVQFKKTALFLKAYSFFKDKRLLVWTKGDVGRLFADWRTTEVSLVDVEEDNRSFSSGATKKGGNNISGSLTSSTEVTRELVKLDWEI